MKKICLILVFITIFYLMPSAAHAKTMSDRKFIEFVKTADTKQVIDALGSGANLNAKGKKSITPLMSALKANNIPVINLLLENPVDVNAADNNGLTPIIYAVIYGTDYRVLDKLINKGADYNTQDKIHGYNALMYAVTLRNSLTQKNKNILPVFAQLLIDAGANLDTEDFNGYSPLAYAAYHYDNYLLTYLFENKTKKYLRNKFGVPDKILRYSASHEEWTYYFLSNPKNKKQKQERWSIMFTIDNNTITSAKGQ